MRFYLEFGSHDLCVLGELTRIPIYLAIPTIRAFYKCIL